LAGTMTDAKNKPSFDVWLRWADVLGQRLETVRQVYSDHAHHDAAMRVGMSISRLHHILAGELERHLAVRTYAVLQQEQGTARYDEIQILALASIFTTVLEQMPTQSKDMQKLLKSPWYGQCNGRLASDLFKGARGTLNEGLGSGLPRDGHLPLMIETLLEQESAGTGRPQRQTTLSVEDQQKWAETARRWAISNSTHLRSAGRVE
jgi:hypothetical protein